MKTLVMIGLQVDLLPGGALETPAGDEVLPIVLNLAPLFDLVALGKFWLPTLHVSFAGNHPWRRPGQVIDIDGNPVLLQPMYCVQESFGAEIVPSLQELTWHFEACMGTHTEFTPYSAFFDTGKKVTTGLKQFLRKNKVQDIHLLGLPLEAEVRNTALDAIALGFGVHLITDACKSRHPEQRQGTLKELERKGVHLVTSSTIIKGQHD